MRKIPFLLLTIFTIIVISVIIVLAVFSFSRYIGNSCDESHMIDGIYNTREVQNFLKSYPDAEFQIKDDTIHNYQCMYWFYHMDGKSQENLWMLTDNTGKLFRSSWMCVDNTEDHPIYFAPHDVPEITQENCS